MKFFGPLPARSRGRPALLWFALALLFGGCATVAPKPDPAESQRIQTVLDRWLQSLGGRAALERLQGLETRTKIEFENSAGSFELHTWRTVDDRYRSEITFPNGVRVTEAYDGTTAWRRHSALGFGFIPAAELAETLRRNSIRAALNVARDYPERRLLADAPLHGRLCHVLSLTHPGAAAETWYFDAENGRVLRLVLGAGENTTDFSDYREVGGIRLPYTVAVTKPSGSFTARQAEVLPDPLVGPSLWKAPPAELLEGTKIAGILDRHLAVIGGRVPVDRVRTRVTRQEINVTNSGLKLRATISQKRPNLMLNEEELPGLGRITTGYDGKTGWVFSELQGYRTLRDAELQQLSNNAELSVNSLLAERCPFRRLIGPAEVQGRRTQAVALASMRGPAGTYFFAEDDGQLLRIDSAVNIGPQGGAMKVTLEFSDFRAIDGIVIPFRVHLTNPATRMITTLLSVQHNVPLDDALFRPRPPAP